MRTVVKQNTTIVIYMKYSEAFLTGCDEKTEWMLPWFFENYKKHNRHPVVLANFGMSDEMLKYAQKQAHAIMDLSKWKGKGWFLKPKSMNNSPSQKTCWIDTDCEVKGDLSGIFKHIEPEKLSMVEDKPWTMRRKEIWHNSGVVAFQDKPVILRMWQQQVEANPVVGDQEVLHSMLNPITKITYIKDLPHKYNVLRIDLLDGREPENPAIIHWTGKKGKDEIRRQMDA